jgi:uncharacterized GH25 family protein
VFELKCYLALTVCALGLGRAAAVEAHDFWVQPNAYRIEPDAPVPITLQVGHGPFRQRSPIQSGRIVRFEAITPDGTAVDLRASLRPGGATDDGALQFREPGTYMVVLETDSRAQSHLPALRFNDYLRAEGLTAALEQRERSHRMDADGSEIYSRRTKALVQVGSQRAGSQAQVTRALGLPLEIVPDVSPYAWPRSSSLPVHVLFEGRPLVGALVKLTNLEHDAQPVEIHLTGEDGRTSFMMPGGGQWLLNVIWSKPLPGTRDTDFETVFSSLSFGL